VLKLNDNHEGANYRRGILLAELEQYAKAVDHFNKVLELNGTKWQAYHYKGVCIIKQKEYDKALDVFREAISNFPDQPRFLIDMAVAHVMKRELNEARGLVQKAITQDSQLRGEIQATPELSGLV
jgi:Flp pilus assembly protein TadD